MALPGKNPLDDPLLSRFRTRSADAASEFFRKLFGSETVWGSTSRTPDLLVDVTTTNVGVLRLARARLAGYETSRVQTESIQIIGALRGAMRKRSGNSHDALISAKEGGAAVSRVEERSAYSVADGTTLILVVPIEAIKQRAALLTAGAARGVQPSSMQPCLDPRDPNSAALIRNMISVWSELASLESIGLARLAQSGYEEVLLNLAVAAVFPQIGRDNERPEPEVGLATVVKARDFIASYASEPIEIARLAASLGLSMRTLQENFRRQFGYSPRNFLLDCRLRLAREALQSPEASTSVTEIAMASGFSDLSNFSAKYRARFGELPSETLRRSRI